ncbi:MAG: S41 family peptidase, partial [Planctomycetota bacterium]
IDAALASLGEVSGLILDFRGNSGGSFDHEAFMGRFVPKGYELKFAKRYASSGRSPYGGPIVCIVDATVRSAGETASAIFREDGRAYTIGESPTAGMSATKTTIELPSGLASLYVATGSNMSRSNEGRGLEGVGALPHETVSFDAKDLAAGKDTLILRAEALLEDYPQDDVPYDPSEFGWEAP